jgi:guanine deaminase
MDDETYMRQAIEMASHSIEKGGGPFGAVIVDKDGNVVAKNHNQVTMTNDPTAHAEMVCIRDACKKLNKFSLEGCTLYTSCESCSMCLSGAYWARVSRIVYGNTRFDAQKINFDDEYIYNELNKPIEHREIPATQCLREEALKTFESWENKHDKIHY